jgi:hypothetical protein
MSKSKKEGKPKRNSINLAKRLKHIKELKRQKKTPTRPYSIGRARPNYI